MKQVLTIIVAAATACGCCLLAGCSVAKVRLECSLTVDQIHVDVPGIPGVPSLPEIP